MELAAAKPEKQLSDREFWCQVGAKFKIHKSKLAVGVPHNFPPWATIKRRWSSGCTREDKICRRSTDAPKQGTIGLDPPLPHKSMCSGSAERPSPLQFARK